MARRRVMTASAVRPADLPRSSRQSRRQDADEGMDTTAVEQLLNTG